MRIVGIKDTQSILLVRKLVIMIKHSIAGLTLLGFKARNSLKRYFHVRPAQFIYPDEKVSWVGISSVLLLLFEMFIIQFHLLTIYTKHFFGHVNSRHKLYSYTIALHGKLFNSKNLSYISGNEIQFSYSYPDYKVFC